MSDIHGNIEALQQVLQEADVEKWYCLGDIVGYNPFPRECVDRIRNIEALTIAGNHDRAVAGELDLNWFNATARTVLKWTERKLTADCISFLAKSDTNCRVNQEGLNVLLAHGSPDPKSPFTYLLSPGDIKAIDPFLEDVDLLFIGHTHVAGYFYQTARGGWNFKPAPTGIDINLRSDSKYVINTGSVGQPRDGNPEASFALFYPEQGKVVIKRKKYNLEAVQRKIFEVGLPESLANRLGTGR